MSKAVHEIKAWVVDYLARELKLQRNQIDERKAFDRYGMDSVAVVAMTGDLSEWLGFDVPATLAYDHPTIESIAGAVADLTPESA
jgi:acyl carrier protein